ncbi:MAG: DNA-3-methyladenine glycosylase I [Pirellulales bacterium]|nr:DNA-3-methyladenine glycosylase I [Pirellulales bacterium]
MAKPVKRCPWARVGNDLYQAYHDQEWGVPVHDDQKQFEFLTLESAQAGLSWATILNKREGYRKAFSGFDPQKVARFTLKRIERLMTNRAIVRNRLKINAAVTNAQAFLKVQEEFDGFDVYIWQFVDGDPIQNRWLKHADVPATSVESEKLSKDLKQRGFKFVGSTIVYAHMQAAGLVNDHLASCFRHPQCQQLA